MALQDLYTLNQLRSVIRRELLDDRGKWWSNNELDSYINDWQNILQSQYEFVWGTATLTFTDTTTTFSISSIAPNAMRLDAVYYSGSRGSGPHWDDPTPVWDSGTPFWDVSGTLTNVSTGRLSPRSPADLDTFQRNWRGTAAAAGIDPVIVYQNNAQTVSFWPPPAGTGTAYFEYPTTCTFVHGTDTMVIPAWTRYTCVSYCLYRAYARFGPNQDLRKAARRRRQWESHIKWIRKLYDAYLPDKAEMLRPGRKWAGQIVRSKPAWPVWR